MEASSIINLFLVFFPWGFVKLAILILIGLYIIFAAVIVRQEQLMARVVEIPFSPILRIISLVHLIATFVAFVLALILL